MFIFSESQKAHTQQRCFSEIKRLLGLLNGAALDRGSLKIFGNGGVVHDWQGEVKLWRYHLNRFSITGRKGSTQGFVASQYFVEALFQGREIKRAGQARR